MVQNSPAKQGDMCSIPGKGRSHMSQNSEACGPQLPKPAHPRAHALQQETPPREEACVPPLEKAHMQQ